MTVTQNDIKFLYFLYKLRCLSFAEIHEFFYQNEDYYKSNIVPLINAHLVSFHKTKDIYALMITQAGIDLIQKYLDIPSETYNIETNSNKKEILKERDVIVEEKFAMHQIALNEFVLAFKRKFGKIEYYDEKFLSEMNNIRPDGMFRFDKFDLFIEQDMGTETAKQLRDKWNKYRRFLQTEYNGTKKIIVTFIIQCQKIEERKLLVKKTILETFDQTFLNNFDIYIGSKEEILKACEERIIVGDKSRTQEFASLMNIHKFKISDGSKLKVHLGGTVYHYYFGSYDAKNHLIFYNPNKKHKGRFQEFLADNYEFSPISVLSKISFHDKNSHNFDIAYSPKANLRLIGYLVLVKDVKTFYNDLKACELIGVQNVFCTTAERLKRMPIQKALMRFGPNGEVLISSDAYFESTIKECHINDLNEQGLRKI